MTSELNIATETAKLINDMSVKVHYYEARLCSCVGASHGAFDPQDDCINGFRYKDPVEYNLLRTSIDFRRVSKEAGMILQGGCQITVPRFQLNHHAIFTSSDSLGGNDLSSRYNIKLQIDGGVATQINCALKADNKSNVSVAELVYSINCGGLGWIAYQSDENGVPNAGYYVSLVSLKAGSGSSIVFLPPESGDATGMLFGLNPATYPHRYIPDSRIGQYIRLYDQVSRGDVIVIDARTKRDNMPMKRGTLDRIKSFDVTQIISVSARGVFYQENIDFTFDGTTIIWLVGKGPAVGTPYLVEFLGKPNYVVFEELAMDRGADTDVIAKRIHLALRNYAETGRVMDLPIDRLPAFDSGFSNGFQG